ncbi:MAG TPA: hypothetical protein PLJ71_08910 [Candidatus Hydrogenedentes bacterium]|nr:hypothetical protein [Candidatus Hydrogenedentota bacterium]HQM48796.1 hypothetical protein [Candidatus Hydrogenedentota bacterium]
MNVPFKTVEEIARRARQEHPAQGDVREAVLKRIRTTAPPRFSDAPLLVFTAVYVTASVIMCTVAINLATEAADPLAPLFALAQTLTL